MRVAQSLSTAGIGVALLAAFGFAGQSKSLQQPQPAKSVQLEKLTIKPVQQSWEEMLQIQASLPPAVENYVVAPQVLPQEPAPIDMTVNPNALDTTNAKSGGMGGIQRAVCPSYVSEPSNSKGFVAQPDVPDGLGFSFIPPDAAGDIGPNHLMTMMANKVTIRNRLGGSVSSVDPATFWASLAPANLTYPRVQYAALLGRWIASARSGTTSPVNTNLFFAISDTNDPTGLWSFYSIVADAPLTVFADWVPLGYNSTWIVMAANMFNAGGTFQHARVWIIDAASALVPGGPITVSVGSNFMTALTGFNLASLYPSRAYDAADARMYLLMCGQLNAGGTAAITGIAIGGTGPAPTLSALPWSLGASSFLTTAANNWSFTQRTVNQVGDARNITPFSTRMASVCQRNGKLWFANTGGLPGPTTNAAPTATGVLWYQIDPNLVSPLLQGGVITSGAGGGNIVPSIAATCGDDALVGFSNSDVTRNPECSYAIHLGSGALGSMGATHTLKTGDSSYWKNFGVGTTAQWGRYSSTGIDPLDDKTFWTLQEYAGQRVGAADNDSRWSTWWGRIGTCGNPTITDDPDPVTVCTGDPASFSVSATPFVGPLAYQWRKNGVNIVGETNSTFSIPATVGADGATYDVIVEDGCGTSTSLGALLDFGGAVVTSHPTSQSVGRGGTATFTVAGTGSGPLSYEWRKNGVPIVPAETNASLVLPNVGRNDIGYYDCSVSDACGPAISNAAFLSIVELNNNLKQDALSLAIAKQPQSGLACVGTIHVLSVTAYGQNLQYVWRKGGVAIVPPETGSTLTLGPISNSDEDSYDCIVSDDTGILVSSTALVDVSDVATITTQPQNQGVHTGDDATFFVTATGDGPLFYQWKKGGLIGPLFNMPGEEDSTLVVPNVHNGDAGRYQCAVTNQCGTKLSATAKLTLIL